MVRLPKSIQVKDIPKFIESLNSKSLILFSECSLQSKIAKLLEPPYHSDKYYHVFDPNNLDSILSQGLSGDEIWFSKSKPHDEYITGYLLELNLDGIELRRDARWGKEHNVFVALSPIPPVCITRVFEYFDSLDMREDKLALAIHTKSPEEIQRIIIDNKL